MYSTLLKKLFLFVFSLGLFVQTQAANPPGPVEGMWIPLLLKSMNEKDMQSLGLRLSAEDIYSVNKSSLKDAIAHFGGGCTSSFISPEGLLLTNHHCGYSQIQSHSTVENDYLTDGFWAMDRAGELKCNGLTVTLIVRIEDVTSKVLDGVGEDIDEAERSRLVRTNMTSLTADATSDNHYNAFIRPFYHGNQYFMFVTETFKDVRMVGAPPSSIGKFGGDTDNWMWPRHTGDFSIFRVYAGKDNKPAEYSEENVPYKPRHFLPVNIKGVDKGDFTMVYGFPGRTQEYLTSFAVDHTYNVANPIKIALRAERLNIMDRYMKGSDKVRIQYAAKYARVSNYHKKWIGENRGLKKLRAIEKKEAFEKEMMGVINKNKEYSSEYGGLFGEFKKAYVGMKDMSVYADYLNEAAFGIETVLYAYRWMDIVKQSKADEPDEKAVAEALDLLKRRTTGHFKNFHQPVDREVMPKMLQMMMEGIPESSYPPILKKIKSDYKGDCEAYAKMVFEKSMLVSQEDAEKFLEKYSAKKYKKIEADPAYELMNSILTHWRNKLAPAYFEQTAELDVLKRKYMKLIMEAKKEDKVYPNANSTLRVAFGQVDNYNPADGVFYRHYTTIDGIMEKHDPNNDEFVLPEKLLELYEKKDYGQYGKDGQLRVCFIASNHTTGGNSGSPVIDGDGNLIGLNFDRNWEGTMSDIMYDPDRCRNISVDTRYILFIVDKFAGASHLVDEMKLIK